MIDCLLEIGSTGVTHCLVVTFVLLCFFRVVLYTSLRLNFGDFVVLVDEQLAGLHFDYVTVLFHHRLLTHQLLDLRFEFAVVFLKLFVFLNVLSDGTLDLIWGCFWVRVGFNFLMGLTILRLQLLLQMTDLFPELKRLIRQF